MGFLGSASMKLGGLGKLEFFQLGLNEAQGQFGPINGHVHFLKQVRHGPDMVLVAVGQQNPQRIRVFRPEN